jgi:hypothetical protein
MRSAPTPGATAVLAVTDSANSFTQSSISVSFSGTSTGGRFTLANFTGLTSLRPVIDNGTAGQITLNSEL